MNQASAEMRDNHNKIVDKLKSSKPRKRWFIVALVLLILFAVFGQIACDRIGLESKWGQFWGYERGLPYLGITICITCAAICLVYLMVRFFSLKNKVMKLLAWGLSIAVGVWMLFIFGVYIVKAIDSEEVYYAGWWIGYVDKLEEERILWEKMRWIGHGEEYYEYSYDIFENSPKEEYHADEEPFHSSADELFKAESVYRYFNSDTLLNVVSYFYGRWVWLIYTLIALYSILASILPIFATKRIPKKIFYSAAWLLYSTIVIMPVLNTCGLVFDGVVGPPFTGFGYTYWEFSIIATGPAIGVMLGLMDRNDKQTTISGENLAQQI